MPWAQFAGYFTEKFWKDHVYEGSEEQAKRDAEEIFQRRDVPVSSVLQLGAPHAIRILVGEVTKRQAEYAGNAGPFTSYDAYNYYERKGKRAKRRGPAKFKYAVRHEEGVYKIHHFDGVA